MPARGRKLDSLACLLDYESTHVSRLSRIGTFLESTCQPTAAAFVLRPLWLVAMACI